MGRTEDKCIWVLNIYYDVAHKQHFKTLEFDTLREIAECLCKPIYEVSNFYHKIKKATGVFANLYLYKSVKSQQAQHPLPRLHVDLESPLRDSRSQVRACTAPTAAAAAAP